MSILDWDGLKTHLTERLRQAAADYIEVRIEAAESSSLRFRGPKLESLEENIGLGGCVRALSSDGWGFAAFNSLDEIDRRIDHAIHLAELAGQNRNRRIQLAPVPVISDVVRPTVKSDPRKVSLADKLDRFQDYNRQILNHREDVTSSVVSYGDRKSRIIFINNEGTLIDQVKYDIGGALVAIATRGADTQMGTVPFGSSNDYDVSAGLEERIAGACDTAADLLEAPSVPGGQYTVIAAPQMAGIFAHEAFGHLSEADDLMDNPRMQKVMKLGRRFGNDFLTIYDTGDTPGSRGHMRYDDEGVAATRADLIREGVLVGRLHSRQSAATLNEAPTGNARALNYRFPPICRMRNTRIEPGDATLEDMLKGIKKGLYVITPYGGQTDDEMFTFMAGKSYYIENGALAGLVRDVNLTGNVFHTLNEIDMVGREVETDEGAGGCGKGAQSPLPVGNWAPHIRINNVTVGGQSQ